MLTAAASPLVQGAASAALKTIRVRALRSFLVGGKRVEIGTEIELDRRAGMELVSYNKAELVTEPAEVMAAAVADLKAGPTPTAPMPTKGKKRGI